jgi:hypothetical protein
MHPQPRTQTKKRTSVVTTGSPNNPAFPAQWFYGLFCALPGDRLFDSHISELQCGAVFDTAKGFEAKPHDLWTGLSIVGGPSS